MNILVVGKGEGKVSVGRIWWEIPLGPGCSFLLLVDGVNSTDDMNSSRDLLFWFC